MIKFLIAGLVLVGAFSFPVSACQQILASSQAIRKNADLVLEAKVASTEPDHGREPSPGDPARILRLDVTRIVKGKVGRSISIPTTGCHVPVYGAGELVKVVRFPGGKYHVVPRHQQ